MDHGCGMEWDQKWVNGNGGPGVSKASKSSRSRAEIKMGVDRDIRIIRKQITSAWVRA